MTPHSVRGVSPLDRIESVYLGGLRIALLTVATLCLIGAVAFAGNALWRVFVSTDVEVAAVEVSGNDLSAAMKTNAPVEGRQEGDGVAASVRDAHALWRKDFFGKYYAVYAFASQEFKKLEDKTLTNDELMSALGYDLQTFADREAPIPLIEDRNYQTQALAAVAAAMKDPGVVAKLREYKAAQKTAEPCSTVQQERRVWDSYSTACSNWYMDPTGCSVIRSVPV